MDVGRHFVSCAGAAAPAVASELVDEIEAESTGLRLWLAQRDLGDSADDPLQQVDEALKHCASVILVLHGSDAASDSLHIEERKRALSYNKPITVVRASFDAVVPLSMSTRLLVDLAANPSLGMKQLKERLLRLSTREGQVESLHEQLAATEQAEKIAPPGMKARLKLEIQAIQQQISSLTRDTEQTESVEARIASGLERERKPPTDAVHKPPQQLRIVNAPPLPVPGYFENRHHETSLIASFLGDGAASILLIHGRGGVGKTALACRVLRELERNRLPDTPRQCDIAAVVYVNATGADASLFLQTALNLAQTAGSADQLGLRSALANPQATVAMKVKEVLARLPSDPPTVLLIDNFEDALNPDDRSIRNTETGEFLQTIEGLPPGQLKVIVTSRIVPEALERMSPARAILLSLADGLEGVHALQVLRKLDADGSVGLKGAPNELLHQVAVETRGFPRALEAFYSILRSDPSRDVADVLADLRRRKASADKLTQILVGDAFSCLLPIDQKVLQALAIYGRPVSLTAVEFLLKASDLYTDCPAVLRRLVTMHFARREGSSYYLHPIDRAHAIRLLSKDQFEALKRHASDYYSEIKKSRNDWQSVEDVEAHVQQFRLRLEAGDHHTAAAILNDIGSFLDSRGAYELKADLATALIDAVPNAGDRWADPESLSTGLHHLASALWRRGRVAEALATQQRNIEAKRRVDDPGLPVAEANLLIYRRALGTTPDLIDQWRETLRRSEETRYFSPPDMATLRHHLASCLEDFGYVDEALKEQQQATQLASYGDVGAREAQLHNLGSILETTGELNRAEALYREALELARESRNPLWEANHQSGLARVYRSKGMIEEAAVWTNKALTTRHRIGDLGGVCHDLGSLAELHWIEGDLDAASHSASTALEQARALKLPLHPRRTMLAEMLLAQGRTDAAYTLLKESDETHHGPRWRMDTLLGIVLLRQGLLPDARDAFQQALGQCELWLSRSSRQPAVHQGRALALAGLAADGDAASMRRAEAACDEVRRQSPPGDVRIMNLRMQALTANWASKHRSRLVSAAAMSPAKQGDGPKSPVFISYASKDRSCVDELTELLSPAVRSRKIELWDDSRIKPGDRWREEIDRALEEARVGVMMVTPAFLASEFIAAHELPVLLEAASRNAVKLIWIHVKHALYEDVGLDEVQCAHDVKQPLLGMTEAKRAETLVEIARTIKNAAGTMP